MSNSDCIDTNDLLTDDLIVDYLQENPDFFLRNPDLLGNLKLADPQRGVVSLVERQQQQQRQKLHALEEEITQLMSVAHHNENLFTLYSELYLRLMDSHSLTDILNDLYETTTKMLSLADCKLWLSSTHDIDHAKLITNNCQAILDNRLQNEPFYFGRLPKEEQQLIFSDDITGSVVLIRLSYEEQLLGFLAIASADAEHFDPKMDTLLLGQFRQLVAKLLAKQLNISN